VFDFITTRSRRVPDASALTTMIAAVLHALVLAVIVVGTLAATEVMPAPRAIQAFIATAAPPPPPPPPPPPAATRATAPKPQPARARPEVVRPKVAAPAPSQVRSGAAPGEAPSGIVEETDFAAEPASFDTVSLYGVTGGVPGGVAGGLGEATEVVVPAPPAPPREPVRVGGRIVAPLVVHRVDPEYPRIAQDARVEGVAILEAVVSSAGRVENVRVLRSHPLLRDAAVSAVEQWRYEPLLLNGTPMPFVLTVTVGFNLR
jgi:protein TonB